MSAPRVAWERTTTVDALAASLRARIIDGDLPAGRRLVERELIEAYRVARHTLRAALRALASEGLVVVEAHRGARVARLEAPDVYALYELRTALELEAAHLALERHGGRLPAAVHAAAARLRAACERRAAPWSEVVDAHDGLHSAIVAAASAPRIARAHATLAGETRLFLVQLRPHWTLERMADDHDRLVADLEAHGPAPLRAHLRESAEVVAAAAGG